MTDPVEAAMDDIAEFGTIVARGIGDILNTAYPNHPYTLKYLETVHVDRN